MEVGSLMKFYCTCPDCGTLNDARLVQVGQEFLCTGCGTTLKVPAPREAVDASDERPIVLRFDCPSCGRHYATKPDLAGKKIRCTGCGVGVRVPHADATFVAQPSKPVLKTFGGEDAKPAPRPDRVRKESASAEAGISSAALLEELASIEGVKRARRAESVLPSRSETMEEVRQKVAEQEAVQAEKQKTKKKKKKKRSGYFDPKETLQLVGGLSAFVAVLAFLAWAYPGMRFPLGGFLCVIGFIVYLLGAASLRQLAAEEGPFKALAFRFVPPYQWWFVATRWADTKDFVSFFLAGLVIMAIGGAVIKTSDVGKQAEESERAYQKARQGNQDDAPPAILNGN
jgi:hypothetical protein